MKPLSTIAAVLLVATLAGCNEEKTSAASSSTPAAAANAESNAGCNEVALVNIAPGGAPPERGKCPEAAKFDGNPEQIAAGRQLFVAYNCVGCHFNGGGGMGPALMDDQWLFGSSMENVAASIREGRPKGMPSFRAMVGDDQVWQLAAYVRSLSNLAERSKKHAANDK